MDALPPADVATIKKGEGCYKCYLHVLQDCIRLDALPAWMTWQMRYFVVDEHGLYSYDSPNMPQTGPHVQVVDLSTATDVQINNPDTFLFTIHFHNVVVPAIQFRAPCQEIMDAMVERIGSLIKDMKKKVDAEKILHIGAAEEALWHEPHAHEMGGGDAHAHSIIDAPSGRYPFMWHCLVYPLKLAFHYTLVDCRTPSMRRYYVQVNLICVVYLGILSYVMILCCDTIGNYLGTTPTVMGLTLSAIGTSFPNMWSSMVVARQGYGNMAICNALGSNIFNICVALGLPWATLVMMHHGKAYDEMKDHGIVMFVLLLEAVCVIWIAMIALSGFKLRAWMAPIFVILYLAVLVLAVTLSNV
jgi:Ca2+/Na+ antiporter